MSIPGSSVDSISRATLLGLVVVVLLCIPVTTSDDDFPEGSFSNEWAAHITGGEDHALHVARRSGLELVEKLSFGDYYILKHHDVPTRSRRSADHHTKRLQDIPGVHWVEQQREVRRVKREVRSSLFNDPAFSSQWYIYTGDLSQTMSTDKRDLEVDQFTRRDEMQPLTIQEDLHVVRVWEMGYSGKNVPVCVLDDGVEKDHDDLSANYDPHASCDLNDNDTDPTPRLDPSNENKHGTRCAGEIAMVANNNNCGVGIAYNAKIGGVRMLDGTVTDSLEAKALTFNVSYINIYSASWGPNDDGKTLEGPGRLTSVALKTGVTKGRGGKGVIYAWASGNGGRYGDDCNCDGYTSSIYTLSVASTTEKGRVPWYVEKCASTITTTYSSGGFDERKVVTSDLRNNCTKEHTGTSASAPMAAGMFALLLEANPELTWRDVQHLAIIASRASPMEHDNGWYRNGAGLCVNEAFGFGLLDAHLLVSKGLPEKWTMVPEQRLCIINASSNSNLPQELSSGNYLEVVFHTDGCHGEDNEVNYLEHIQFFLTMNYTTRGRISVSITSPSGTKTTLLHTRSLDQSRLGINDWPLMSVHTWGENPAGDWVVRISDISQKGKGHGLLQDVRLALYGTKDAPAYRLNNESLCDLANGQADFKSTPAVPSEPSPPIPENNEIGPETAALAGNTKFNLQSLTGVALSRPLHDDAILSGNHTA